MQPQANHQDTDRRIAIALKAFNRVMEEWNVPVRQAAALADMSESTWKRARRPAFTGSLTHDQLLRLSAVIGIYKALKLYFSDSIASQWIMLPNQGPLFDGARPLDKMIAGGLPQFLHIRTYLDALRGGM